MGNEGQESTQQDGIAQNIIFSFLMTCLLNGLSVKEGIKLANDGAAAERYFAFCCSLLKFTISEHEI